MHLKMITATLAGVISLMIVGCSTPTGFPYDPTQFIPPKARYSFITAQSFKEIVGTTNVKIAFNSKSDACIYYIDYTDSIPEAKKLKKAVGRNDFLADSPILSPDGEWVAYFLSSGTVNEAYVQKLDSVAEPVKVGSGYSTDPHWWTDPSDSSLWVIYSDLFLVDMNQLNGLTGYGTYKQKVTLSSNLAQLGSPVLIADKPFNGGLSKDGKYLCTGYSEAAFYGLSDPKVLTIVNKGLQICNPSITPALDTTDRMMFLNFAGTQNMDQTLLGADTLGKIRQHEVICIIDSKNVLHKAFRKPAGYEEWQDPEWSNNLNFAAALAGTSGSPKYDGFIIDLSKKTYSKLLTSDSRDKFDNTSTPYIWIGK